MFWKYDSFLGFVFSFVLDRWERSWIEGCVGVICFVGYLLGCWGVLRRFCGIVMGFGCRFYGRCRVSGV